MDPVCLPQLPIHSLPGHPGGHRHPPCSDPLMETSSQLWLSGQSGDLLLKNGGSKFCWAFNGFIFPLTLTLLPRKPVPFSNQHYRKAQGWATSGEAASYPWAMVESVLSQPVLYSEPLGLWRFMKYRFISFSVPVVLLIQYKFSLGLILIYLTLQNRFPFWSETPGQDTNAGICCLGILGEKEKKLKG